ncbi:histidinol-phosphate transaminase [Nevskia soli]|uniref:histidinol-phosphate transaminase n=1 Tax=Nevskia soli TaxID=418856 RepID=UPI0004A72EBD|nr:histidinol-phosphate transaminase [Nevskia soli]
MSGKKEVLPFFEFVAPGVMELHPYEPGMPVEELQRRLGVSNAIKLASNENPLGPSPKVKAALAAASEGNLALYPDDGGFRLKARLAALHGVGPESITLCNGSNTLLDLVARVFLGPGRAAMYSKYAFAVYPLVTLAQSAESIVVPALPDDSAMPYGDDVEAMARMLRPDVAVIFIASPNNPTGTWVEPAAFERFMAQVPAHTVVVLDEAYHHFQDPATRIDSDALMRRYPNLMITRTFSKVHGIAALRIGYGVAHPQLTDLLHRVRQPFNNGSLALLAAELALEDTAHVARCVELNAQERKRVTAALQGMGLRVLPTQANFVTVDFGKPSAPIHQALLEQGVIVRPMGSYLLPNFLRVSIGTEAENDRFLAALKKAVQA